MGVQGTGQLLLAAVTFEAMLGPASHPSVNGGSLKCSRQGPRAPKSGRASFSARSGPGTLPGDLGYPKTTQPPALGNVAWEVLRRGQAGTLTEPGVWRLPGPGSHCSSCSSVPLQGPAAEESPHSVFPLGKLLTGGQRGARVGGPGAQPTPPSLRLFQPGQWCSPRSQ